MSRLNAPESESCAYFRLIFAYTVPDGVLNPGAEAVHSGVQAVPAGCVCRGEGVPFPVDRGRLPAVRRTAPVPAIRGPAGAAQSSAGETSAGGNALRDRARLHGTEPRIDDQGCPRSLISQSGCVQYPKRAILRRSSLGETSSHCKVNLFALNSLNLNC